jgi:hypothetical protein
MHMSGRSETVKLLLTSDLPPLVRRRHLDSGAVQFITDKGSVDCVAPVPHVLLFRYRGHAERWLFDPLSTALFQATERTSGLHLFVDAEELESYDSEFRARWVSWFRIYRARVGRFHFLYRSPLVAVGMQILNLATGGMIKPYRARLEFDLALNEAVCVKAAKTG